eukprot:CAMPEP_0176372616 /NCGR_PEP_ID=MMETSP0126-20121128/25506_1 /TAXON_ID=141414 ORGANISM="Strombidinopsis acuminatum, Strain SPMC142" /NCGR_SAMPLE_ID=MMETSP0126 /ASSEMBLY_ACC=CAM_ASM_000229 /LENGTH=54 /DNA_ID=CAMNT_0017732511 /DNA_START=336 /DNA_END=500 /DNA_ORIENTATION=+
MVDLIYKNEEVCLFSGVLHDTKTAMLAKCQPDDLKLDELFKKYVLKQSTSKDEA